MEAKYKVGDIIATKHSVTVISGVRIETGYKSALSMNQNPNGPQYGPVYTKEQTDEIVETVFYTTGHSTYKEDEILGTIEVKKQ